MAKKAEATIDDTEDERPAPVPAAMPHDAETLLLIQELAADAEGISDEEMREAGLYDDVMAARAKMAEEPGKEGASAAGEATTEAESEAKAKEPEEAPEPEPAGKNIPKARFDQEVQKRREAERQLGVVDELRAEIAAMKAQMASGKPAEPPPPPPGAERLDEIKAELRAVRKQYEDGEIDFIELRDKEDELNDERSELRQKMTAGKREDFGSLALQERTAELERANPWIGGLSPLVFTQLAEDAKAALVAEGVSLNTEHGVYALRARVVEMGKAAGLDRLSTKPQPSLKPAQPTALERGKKAAEVAANHPPDTGTISAPRSGSVLDMDREQLEGLSHKDLDALPDSVFAALQKRLGLSA